MLTPEDAAAYWYARLLSKSISQEETAALERWLAASDENQNAFSSYRELLSTADGAAEEILSQKFEAELNELALKRRTSIRRFAALAATLVMIVGLAGIISTTIFSSATPERYATIKGEINEVMLADGSTAKLNTNTVLEVLVGPDERRAFVRSGEVMFNVEKDNKRPFIVETPQGRIIVTGTVFDVCVIDGQAAVYVLSGAIEVKPANSNQVTLLSGQSLHIDHYGIGGDVTAFDPSTVLAWRRGKLRFAETPLEDVVQELNRYFTKSIVLGDPSLTSLPVTGEFDTNDEEAAIAALTIIFDLKKEIKNDVIVLSKEQG